jgi:hypothetical protein
MSEPAAHQVGVDELRTLDPEQTRDALQSGRLDSLLAGHDPGPPPDLNREPDELDEQPEQLSRDQLKGMDAAEIHDALDDGRLDQLLGRR